MGLPYVQTTCYHALGWGDSFERALRRLIKDKSCPEELRSQAEAVADATAALNDLLLSTGRSIKTPA